MNQQPIVIKQGMSIWGAIGWLLFFGLLYIGWQEFKVASDINQVPGILDTAVQTLEPIIPAVRGTAVPNSGLTNFTVVDGKEPEIVNAVPILPTQGPATQVPESVIDYAAVLAEPTATRHQLSDEQLLACLSAQNEGRRMAPYCPTNAAELLGPGR